MSIEICAFLGPNLDNLELRYIAAFKRAGFTIELHPKLGLLQSNSAGYMCVAILETPPALKRLAPEAPLLASFGYIVVPHSHSEGMVKRVPKSFKECSYEIYTRTSAGRSRSSYFMQAFTAAILAKETGGHVLFEGDKRTLQGGAALKKIMGELNGLDASVSQMLELMATLETECGVAEANRFGRSMQNSLDAAFDVGAYPFSTWPPIDDHTSFTWPNPICLPPFKEKRESWWSRIKLWHIPGFVVVALFVLITLIYS